MSPYYTTGQNYYEFVAHGTGVTCLSLGQKSGRVMVTGGEDAKLNLWAIGKPNCIMSLNGHRTAIECTKFNQNEDIVAAGSASGAIKLWDLEAAKLMQTLNGHKTNVRCIDFHPYGHFLASGSFDTSIKLWDYRKKSCIITYKIHSKDVHCLKLSPDGRWLASGGNEGTVMLYDIVASKMLAELNGHQSPITDLVFHPNEFLLSSCSLDGTIKFWDLESFLQVSTTTTSNDNNVKKISFHPNGKTLIACGTNSMKIYGWEPIVLYDQIKTSWGKSINDLTIMNQECIAAATINKTNVSVYMINLNTIKPFNCNYQNSVNNQNFENFYNINQNQQNFDINERKNLLRSSTRKSFNFEQMNKTCKQLESLNQIDDNIIVDDPNILNNNNLTTTLASSLNEIYNTCDYKEIFQSRRELMRTPPPPQSLQSPETLAPSLPPPQSSSSLSLSLLQQLDNDDQNNQMIQLNNKPLTKSIHLLKNISESLNNLNLNQCMVQTTNDLILQQQQQMAMMKTSINNEKHQQQIQHSTSLNCLNSINQYDHQHHPHHHHHNQYHLQSITTTTTTTPSIGTTTTTGATAGTTFPIINQNKFSIQNQNQTQNLNLNQSPNIKLKSLTNSTTTTTITTPTTNKITKMVRPIINKDTATISTNNRQMTNFHQTNYDQIINHKSIPSSSSSMSSSMSTIQPTSSSLLTVNNSANDQIIPEIRDNPHNVNNIGELDFNEFLPKKYLHHQQQNVDNHHQHHQQQQSEIETINKIISGHKITKQGLDYRRKQVQIVLAMWTTKDSRTALEYAINLDEKSIIIDLLNVMIWKPTVWNLDIALILLPCIQELLQSKYESYMSAGCSALSLILKTFSTTIKNNISAPPGIGVDISREERYNKCMKCYNYLLSARAFVLKRQTLQGKIGRSFRELSILMQNLD